MKYKRKISNYENKKIKNRNIFVFLKIEKNGP